MPGIRSGEYQNKRYNSKLISNRLIVEALVPKFYGKGEDIAAAIVARIDPIIDNFFFETRERTVNEVSLTELMGESIDLAAQGIPNARPWNALSAEYVKRKGNDLFWSYTHSVDTKTLIARLKITRRGKVSQQKAREASLISTLEHVRGIKAFGGTTVTVSYEGVEDVVITRTSTFKVNDRGRKKAENFTQITGSKDFEQTVRGLKVKLKVRIWSEITRSEIPNIEFIMAARGAIDLKTAQKLFGRTAYHRPLIRPLMSYYSTVLIPHAIEDTIRRRFGGIKSGTKIEVTAL